MSKRTKLSYGDFRPLHKGEAGYSSTKRTYVSPSSGELIPVARFQKLAKGPAPKTAKPSKPNTKYTNFISQYVDRQNNILASSGNKADYTRGEARKSVEFKRAYADLQREGKKKRPDKSAHGKLAMALEDLGIREENADYPVGETPD